MRTSRLLQFLLAATLMGSAARAGQITFTMTADVTGTLGATPFTDALLTVTSVADTSGVFVTGGIFYELIATSSTVSIAGVTGSPATFTGATFWEDPNGSGDILFGDASGGSGFGCVAAGCPILGFVNFVSGPPFLTFLSVEFSHRADIGQRFPRGRL